VNKSLPNLDTFLTVVEAGSFTAAARQLQVTQAAISQRISALEREVGVSLFSRQGGRAQLSDAGRRLHTYVCEIFSLHERARAELTGMPVAVTGELMLASSSLPGEHLLPCYLARYQQRYPQVRVRVRVVDSQQVFTDLGHGRAHLGLAGDRGTCPNLEHHRFARDEMRLVVPFGHPLAKRKVVTIKDLTGLPLIVREPGSGTRHCLEQAFAQVGLSLAQMTSLELGSNEAIKEAILRGVGVAFLPELVVHDQVAADKLFSLQVKGVDLSRDLYAVYDRRRVLPITAQLFLELLLAPP
jgi:DNA-binding transcriptional LysR family regulator